MIGEQFCVTVNQWSTYHMKVGELCYQMKQSYLGFHQYDFRNQRLKVVRFSNKHAHFNSNLEKS